MLFLNKKIAIVGGGPGGLTLARLLQLQGADVQVFERDVNEAVRAQGATLDLHEESGLEALRRAGLIEAFYAHYRPDAGKVRILDEQAEIYSDDHATGTGYTDSRPEIDRAPLRNLLLQALQPGTVVWDRHFVSMEDEKDGWRLHFKNGTTVYADLVIGADGAHSKIRSYIIGIAPIYSGVTIVEGQVYHAAQHAPNLWALVRGGKIFAFGNEQSLILSAKGEGSLSFYTGCKVPETWVQECGVDFSDHTQVFSWFKTAYGSWNKVWLELFTNGDAGFIPRPQYHFPLDQHWNARPNLTMLGDAAHRMPPYAGEGVNMAMQDAFELSGCITGSNFVSLQEAIAHYENGMLKRASEVTRFTLANTEMLHAKDALEQMVAMMSGQ